MRGFVCLLGVMVGLCWPTARAAERTWQVTGTLLGFKPGTTTVAVIELPDKSRIEVPVAALSEADQQVVRGVADGGRSAVAVSGTVTVRGPMGRVTLPVPESLKAVETDAIWCRTAADAVKVYRLHLAADDLPAEARAAAAARLGEWMKRSADKQERMGDAWLSPEQRSRARHQAHEQLLHAIEVIRLGNWKLAEDELEKASRLDPDFAGAELVLGLGYFLVKPRIPGDAGPHLVKAIEFFAEAVRREPDNVNALTDLGIAEMVGGKYAAGVSHLVRAAELAMDDQVIADNLGLFIREAPTMRPKMPDKLLVELNDSYRSVMRHPRLKPLPPGATVMLKSPSGRSIAAGRGTQAVADLAQHVAEGGEWIAEIQTGEAAVVGDGLLLTTIPLVPEATEILVDDPTAPGRQLPAREVAASGDAGVFLLHCEGLIAKPLPLAAKGPADGEEVSIWGKPVEGSGRTTPRPVRGRVVNGPANSAGSRADGGRGPMPFVHRGAVARGPGGGPIVDRQGRLLGLEAPLPRTDASGNTHGLGLPIDAAWPLLKEHLPELAATASVADTPPDWTGADAGAAAGAVVVTCRRKVSGQPPK